MTVEQLMQPRYKVIADYPDSKLRIGDIIEFWLGENYLCLEPYLCISHPEKYPAVFRKLEWWEERDEKDMPKYVKSKSEINPTVQRLARFDLESDSKWRMFLHHSIAAYNPYDYLPATEQEYNDYINQFKEK